MTTRSGAVSATSICPFLLAFMAMAVREGSAASMPDWATQTSVEMVAGAFPNAETIQVLDYTDCRIDERGTREFTSRSVFLVQSGGGEDCGTESFVKSVWSEPLDMTAWKRDVQGRVERFSEPVMTQIHEGALYNEDKRFVLSVPGIEPGTLVAFEIRGRLRSPSFGSLAAVARMDIPVYHWEYTLSVPEGIRAEGFWLQPAGDSIVPAEPAPADQGRYRWTREKTPDMGEQESGQPDDAWLAPRLLVRWPDGPGHTMQTWRSVADWYRPISESAFEDDRSLSDVVETIRQALAAIPAGEPPIGHVQQKAVADFVRSKIGYVQIYMKDGGIRPHKAFDVYENRYGDCKDMAHLAIALLRGVGERAYPVLTDTGRDPAIREGFPTVFFDHCIVAIEDPLALGGIRFFDPTAKNVPFGRLPCGLQGAPAIVIGHEDAPELHRFPVESSAVNGRRSKARVVLDSGLNVQAAITEWYYGHPAYEMRAWLQEQKAEDRLRWLTDRFTDESARSSVAEIRFSDLEAIEDTLRIEYALQVPGSARRIGDKVIWHPDVFPRDGRRVYGDEARRRPVQFRYPGRWERIIEAELPVGWMPEEVPSPLSVANSVGTYERTISIHENRLQYRSAAVFDSIFVPIEAYGMVQALDQARCESDRKGLLLRPPG